MRAVATLCMLCSVVLLDLQVQASVGEIPARESQSQFLAEWAARTAAIARRTLERARTAPSSDLKLEVASEQSEYVIFSPVTVFVRLSNTGAEAVTGNLQLGETYGRLFAYVRRPGYSFVPYVSQALVLAQLDDMIVPNLSLPAGACIVVRASLVYNHITQDYVFPHPGTYGVKMVFVYDKSDYTKVSASNVAEIRVVSPPGDEAQVLSLFEDVEQARALQGESNDPDAIAQLRAVVETCADSEYALYARAALLQRRPAVRDFELPAADRLLGPRHRAMLEQAIVTLHDTSQTVYTRMGAALRLGEQFGHEDAISALLSVINHPSSPREVRLSAVIALSQIPNRSAVEALLDVAILQRESLLRERAREQLSHMGVHVGSVRPRAVWEVIKETWVPRSAGHADVILDDSSRSE